MAVSAKQDNFCASADDTCTFYFGRPEPPRSRYAVGIASGRNRSNPFFEVLGLPADPCRGQDFRLVIFGKHTKNPSLRRSDISQLYT